MARPSKKGINIVKITDASLRCCYDHGLSEITVGQVAKKAGLSVGTIYLYYENKEELIANLYVQVQKRFDEVILPEITKESSGEKQFKRTFSLIFKYYMSHPLEFSFIEQYTNSSYSKSIFSAFSGSVQQLFHKMYKENMKEDLIQKLPLVVISSMIHGSIVALVKKHHQGQEKISITKGNQLIAALWKGISV